MSEGDGAGEPFRLLGLTFPAAASAEAPSALAAEIEVPAGSPCFTGHFPGHPVLPGICHLALVRHVLAAAAARGARGAHGTWCGPAEIREVSRLRLRRLIRPGSQIVMHITTPNGLGGNGGRGHFEIRNGTELASHGDFSTATEEVPVPAVGGSVAHLHDAGGVDRTFPPAAALLPHTPPALLLVEVLDAGDGAVAASAAIPPDHPLAADGQAPGFLAIEIGAQAAGALYGLAQDRAGGVPRIGYLAGVRHASLPATLPTGRLLTVTASHAGGAGGLALYEIALAQAPGAAAPRTSDTRQVATCTLSTFLPDESAEDQPP